MVCLVFKGTPQQLRYHHIFAKINRITSYNVCYTKLLRPPLVGQYYSKEAIVTVVPDSKVDAILDAIAKVACTGTKGDGKVFVTNVENRNNFV